MAPEATPRRLAVALLAAAFTACGSSPPPTPAGKLVPLTVNWPAVSGVNGGLWTAYEAGYFRSEGIDVNLTHIPSSSRAIPALVAGEVQVGAADGLTLVQAAGGGADVKAVMGVTNRLVFSVMASPRVQSPADLKGAKVGITRFGSSTHTAALQALRLWHLDPRDVTFIQLSEVPNIVAALQSGQVDAGVVSPPSNVRARRAGFKELTNLAVSGPAYSSVTIAAKTSWLAANRDVMTRFVRAYSRGVHRLRTDKKFAMQAMNKYLKLEDQTVVEDTWTQFSKYIALPPYVEGMEAVVDDAATQDPRLKGARTEQFVDTSIVRQLDASGFFRNLTGGR